MPIISITNNTQCQLSYQFKPGETGDVIRITLEDPNPTGTPVPTKPGPKEAMAIEWTEDAQAPSSDFSKQHLPALVEARYVDTAIPVI